MGAIAKHIAKQMWSLLSGKKKKKKRVGEVGERELVLISWACTLKN